MTLLLVLLVNDSGTLHNFFFPGVFFFVWSDVVTHSLGNNTTKEFVALKYLAVESFLCYWETVGLLLISDLKLHEKSYTINWRMAGESWFLLLFAIFIHIFLGTCLWLCFQLKNDIICFGATRGKFHMCLYKPLGFIHIIQSKPIMSSFSSISIWKGCSSI